jgi:hypothetical protein
MNGYGKLSAFILTSSTDKINGSYFSKVTCPSLSMRWKWVKIQPVPESLRGKKLDMTCPKMLSSIWRQ